VIEIKVNEIGESVTEGTIAKWLVREGDRVHQGDLLLELETDKVNLEISAEQSGVIAEIRKREGDTVQVGEVIGLIREGADAAPAEGQSASSAAAGAAPAPEAVRSSGEGVPAAGAQAAAGAGNTSGGVAASAASAASGIAAGETAAYAATPAARKLARERGLDWKQVPASDPNGRVFPGDVRSYQPGASSQPATPAASAGSGAPPGQPSAPAAAPRTGTAEEDGPAKPVEWIRMSRRRQTIANRLVEAQRTAAMLTTFNEVDMTAIMDIRKRRKESFKEKHDVGLGFMSFFTKAVVGALKKFPLLNAEIIGDQILVKKYYDIGIAVAAKEGLVVPVVRDADRLSFAEIERQIAELANKARSNTLSLSELQGGTFTITNGGVFGSLLSTPILNAPQVGILGMHKIQLRPVAIDKDRMENRPMMYIALSYDHRIVDGAEAVQFLVAVKEMLEDPETLLLEG